MAEQTLTPLGNAIKWCDDKIEALAILGKELNIDPIGRIIHYREFKKHLQSLLPEERALAEKMYTEGKHSKFSSNPLEAFASSKQTFDKFYTQEPK